MKNLVLITAIVLLVCLSAQAEEPKIIIRSPYDFGQDISLKVNVDPRFVPTNVLIKAISEMGMQDDNGVKIISGFDVDVQNDLVLGYIGGGAQIIKASQSAMGLSLIASFKGSNGSFVSPPKSALALYTTSGERLFFEYKDVQKAAPKMAFILLLDRSGSMVDVISDVAGSADVFLKDLPPSSQCALASFNDTYIYHNETFQSCNDGDFDLESLRAGGQTEIYAPLLKSYEILSRDVFKDHQKAVILITDGQIDPDEDMKNALLAAKGDILTFVYFLGQKNEQSLTGLANAFLQSASDLKTSLPRYFQSLSTAYGMQKVLEVRPVAGGDYAR